MREAVEVAASVFQEGLPLIKMVDRRLAFDLDLSAGAACAFSKRSSSKTTTSWPYAPGDFENRPSRPLLALGLPRAAFTLHRERMTRFSKLPTLSAAA